MCKVDRNRYGKEKKKSLFLVPTPRLLSLQHKYVEAVHYYQYKTSAPPNNDPSVSH